MADDFDFNVAPVQDEQIDMAPRDSDDDESGSNDDGDVPNFGGIEAELMGGDPDDDEESVDSEEAEFRRRVHALISGEAEESGSSDDDESGFDSESESGSGSESADAYRLGPTPFAFEFDLDPAQRPGKWHWEDHDEYNDRREQIGMGRLKRRFNFGNDDDMSVLSGDTEDSWDERTEFNHRTGESELLPSHKKLVSLHRQLCYRLEHSGYVAKLKAADKTLAFTNFGQLPPELRLRIWELHCPEMQRSQRVLQLQLAPDGHLSPGPTMAQQTKHTRDFMRICQETRALAERYMPDTLHVGVSVHDDAILRYHAQQDIVHFMTETSSGLDYVKAFLHKQEGVEGGDTTTRKDKTTEIAAPHTSVRNIAMLDVEIRTREPGTYFDSNFGHSVIELVLYDDASHRTHRELRPPGYSDALDYMFPNVENIYVLEHGAPRKSDRWIGHNRSYARHHIRTVEILDPDMTEPLEYLYCWHGPPKGFRGRQALPVDKETEAEAPADNGERNSAAAEPDAAASGGDGANDADDASPPKDTAEADDGDFKDDCLINAFDGLRKKGVRFSRMLYFESDASMEDYYSLRDLTCPDGTWPNEDDGEPIQDALPMIYGDGDGYDDEEDDEEMSDDSFVVPDDDEGEGDEDGDGDDDNNDGGDGKDEDEDDLEILGTESLPLEALFSSPEPESGDDAAAAEQTTKASRGKKRRVVSDSEDDDVEADKEPSPSRRSKNRRVMDSDDDDDVHVTVTTNRKKPIVVDDDDDDDDEEEEPSSHTEEGDEEDSDESDDSDESEEEHPKKLSLMQMLQQNRVANPVSDDEAERDSDDDAEQSAGDYDDGNGDEDDEDDEDDE